MVSLRCPRCLSPVPASAARCAICGNDPHAPAGSLADADGPIVLAPRLVPLDEAATYRHSAHGWMLPLIGSMAGLAIIAGALVAVGLLAASAGLGVIAWPALATIGAVVAVAVALQVERRRRALDRIAPAAKETGAPTDLDLIHLFAGRFAPPSQARSDEFHPPLARAAVRAEEAAWRGVAATLLDLAEHEVIELEPHALPTPSESVHVLAVRLVRPLPAGDPFATRLLHPLARRGVGDSTTVSELVGQLVIIHPHPGRALLDYARDHLMALGFYRPGGAHRVPVLLRWARALLPQPLEPDPERVAAARPALEALEARLAAWDERDPSLAAAFRHEVLAACLRARARARRTLG